MRLHAEPYQPINTPKPVADGLWIVDGPIMQAGPHGLIPAPVRMTIVRLPDGTLWLHSPVQFGEALNEAVRRLGPVGHLIAPSLAHKAFIADWQRAHPHAALHAVEGVAEQARKSGQPLRVDHVLTATPDARWGGALAVLLARGSYTTEAVFFHAASRTLILTDLIENFEAQKLRSPALRLAARASGTLAPHGSTPRYYRLTFLGRRRAALRKVVRTMLAWAPEQVIFAHGRWYDRDGAAQLRRAFAWLEPEKTET